MCYPELCNLSSLLKTSDVSRSEHDISLRDHNSNVVVVDGVDRRHAVIIPLTQHRILLRSIDFVPRIPDFNSYEHDIDAERLVALK